MTSARADLPTATADEAGARPSRPPDERRLRLLALALVGATVALRLLSLRHGSLSYDGLHSVTFAAEGSALDVVRVVARWDPHPPLYYLQLHAWFEAFPTTTLSARLNAVLFSVLAGVALLAAAVPRFGWRVALLATAAFALSPYAGYHAQDARMYSLWMLIAVGAWWATARVVEGHRDLPAALAVAATSAAATTVHAAGPLLVLAAVAYGVLWMAAEPRARLRPWAWLATWQVAGAAVVIPWALQQGAVSVDHTLVPSPSDVARTAFELLLGERFGSTTWLVWAAAALVVAVVALAAASGPEVRRLVTAFLVTPVVAAAAISVVVQPIWLPRTFAACLPFLCLALAVVIDRGLRWRPGPTIAGAAVLGGVMLVAGTAHPGEWSVTFRDAAALVEREAAPDDVVVLGGRRVLWGYGWYALGPGSVSARPDADPPRTPPGRPALLTDDGRTALPAPTTSGDTWFVAADGGASYRRYVEHHRGSYDVEVRSERRIGALQVVRARFAPHAGP